MKKLIAIAAILMLVPFSAFGLEMLTDDVMEDVTGQSGVQLTFGLAAGDDTIVTISMDGLSWGDDDGFAAAGGNAGAIIVEGTITQTITIAGGSSLTIDVDGGAGIVLGVGGLDVDIAVANNTLAIGGMAGTGFSNLDSDHTLGYLTLQNQTIDLQLPSAIVISPKD